MPRIRQDYTVYGQEMVPERPGAQPLDWAMLILRSAMRRKVLFLAMLVAGSAAVFGYYRLKQPVYRVEAKIFAQRQQVVPSSVRSATEDSPTRTAWELIHRRENLVALIKSADLLATDPRAVGSMMERFQKKEREDPLDRMVKVLDKRLVVVPEEGTIAVSLDWSDPQKAYRVVEGALQNFIEARHVQEVTAIDEVISVLRARQSTAKEQLDRVTDAVRRETVETYREPGPASAPRAAPVPRVQGPSEELIRMKSMLDAKVRAIDDVEDFRRRRLADLHAQLDEKKNTYSDAHPSVIQLKEDIESLSKESSQVEALRAEEVKLRKDYQVKLAQEGVAEAASAAAASATTAPVTQPSVRPAVRPQRALSTPVEDDERVRDARFQYQQIVERVNAAQLELDATRAAFKYRYNVIWPPQVPTEPISPDPIKIFGTGILAVLFMALLIAACPDLWAGRIIVRWQVERALDLPILGEIVRK